MLTHRDGVGLSLLKPDLPPIVVPETVHGPVLRGYQLGMSRAEEKRRQRGHVRQQSISVEGNKWIIPSSDNDSPGNSAVITGS